MLAAGKERGRAGEGEQDGAKRKEGQEWFRRNLG
jgi:hypothetical protein